MSVQARAEERAEDKFPPVTKSEEELLSHLSPFSLSLSVLDPAFPSFSSRVISRCLLRSAHAAFLPEEEEEEEREQEAEQQRKRREEKQEKEETGEVR